MNHPNNTSTTDIIDAQADSAGLEGLADNSAINTSTNTAPTDDFPPLAPSPHKGEVPFTYVHPKSHILHGKQGKKHDRDSPRTSNPGRENAKTAKGVADGAGRRVRSPDAPIPPPSFAFGPAFLLTSTQAAQRDSSPFIADDIASDETFTSNPELLATPRGKLFLSSSAASGHASEDATTIQALSESPSPSLSHLGTAAVNSDDVVMGEDEDDIYVHDGSVDENHEHPSPEPSPPHSRSHSPSPPPSPSPTTRRRRNMMHPPIVPQTDIPVHYRLLRNPPDGKPRVEGMDAARLWNCLDDESRELWKRLVGEGETCVIVTTIGQGTRTNPERLKHDIRSVISYNTGSPNPRIAVPTYRAGTTIRPLIISNIAPSIAYHLEREHLWATQAIGFVAWSPDVFVAPFVMSLQHVDLTASPAGVNALIDVVRKKLRMDDRVTDFVKQYHEAYSMVDNEGEAVNRFLRGIRITPIDLGIPGKDKLTAPSYNVCINPPSKDPEIHATLVSYLRRLHYQSILGAGSPTPLFNCVACNGRDHPGGLCPFMRMHPWGAQPTCDTATTSTLSGSTQGAPQNGGGSVRGQGGGRRRGFY